MTFTSSQRLYALGGMLLAALLVCSRSPGPTGGASFLVPLVIAGVVYLLVIRELFRVQGLPRRVILSCLALAALCRVPFFMMPPGADDDIHRYLWDGRAQRFGYNPYTVIPADPALATLHTPDTRGLNNPEVPSPYPAGAQLFFRAVTGIHESIFAFKIAFTGCDVAIVVLLLRLLRRTGQGEHWVLAYAWHPLIPANVVGSGHIDIVGALLLLISFAALGRHWRMIAATTFALAVAVKFLPIVLAPLYWRRVRIRDALVAVLLFGLVYLPFLERGRIPIGSLGTYVQRFRFNDPLFATLESVASPQLVAVVAVLVGLVVAAWLRSKPTANSADLWAFPMAASLVCAPVVYPWYLLWVLPFVRSTATLPLVVWTVSILPTYFVWYLRTQGREWHVPGWTLMLEYGCVAVVAAVVLVRRMAQPVVPDVVQDAAPANYALRGGPTEDRR